jgi:hypothetical protein
MRSSVIAFFLSACSFTFNAIAHDVPNANYARPAAAKASARPAAARPTAELITAAGAVTHDGAPGAQATPARTKNESADKPRRTGSAMLLAALALMSGIALRRYSARDQ